MSERSLGPVRRFIPTAAFLLAICPAVGAAWAQPAAGGDASAKDEGNGKSAEFPMQGKPWAEVFRWLEAETGKPVERGANDPPGILNFIGPVRKKYTIPQVIDILNDALLAPGEAKHLYLTEGPVAFTLTQVDDNNERLKQIRLQMSLRLRGEPSGGGPAAAPIQGKTVQFQMAGKPWGSVFKWLAGETGKAVVLCANDPPGAFSFNMTQDKKYTIPQVINILNDALLAPGEATHLCLVEGTQSFTLTQIDDGNERLRQIRLQLSFRLGGATSVFSRPDVTDALKLTADLLATIKKIQEGGRKKLLPMLLTDDRYAEIEKNVSAQEEETFNVLLAVLTENQRAALKEMIGEPYALMPPRSDAPLPADSEPGLPRLLRLLARKSVQQELNLSQEQVEKAARLKWEWQVLKGLHGFNSLELFSFGGSITDAGLMHLGELTNLQTLHLRLPRSKGRMKDLQGLKNLQHLSLAGWEKVDLEGLGALDGLQTLSLESAADATGVEELAALKQLKELNLRRTRLTEKLVKEVARLQGLQSLLLRDCGVSSHAVLKELAALQGLQTLDLARSQTGDADLKELAPLKELKHLDLSYTQITSAGLKYLTELKGLQTLDVRGKWEDQVEVEEVEIDKLQKALPDCKIVFSHVPPRLPPANPPSGPKNQRGF